MTFPDTGNFLQTEVIRFAVIMRFAQSFKAINSP